MVSSEGLLRVKRTGNRSVEVKLKKSKAVLEKNVTSLIMMTEQTSPKKEILV